MESRYDGNSLAASLGAGCRNRNWALFPVLICHFIILKTPWPGCRAFLIS